MKSVKKPGNYCLICDNCCTKLGGFSAMEFDPQDVITHAILLHGWSIYGEHSHCPDCPPLCMWCGTEFAGSSWCAGCGAVAGSAPEGEDD